MTQKERLVELLLPQLFMFSAVDCGKLADCLLDNGVIVPPCKVGDTVYVINHRCFLNNEKQFDVELFVDTLPFTIDMIGRIGKTIFLTREEAENILYGVIKR